MGNHVSSIGQSRNVAVGLGHLGVNGLRKELDVPLCILLDVRDE